MMVYYIDGFTQTSFKEASFGRYKRNKNNLVDVMMIAMIEFNMIASNKINYKHSLRTSIILWLLIS